MAFLKSSLPVLDVDGTPAIGWTVRAYRRDTGDLIGESVTVPGGGDQHIESVELLLRMNGPQAGTSFPDLSFNTKTTTPFGDVQTTTVTSLFGDSSAVFDGINDYIVVSDASLVPGTGDFTQEAWIWRKGTTGSGVNNDMLLFDMRKSGATNSPLVFLGGEDVGFRLTYFSTSNRIIGAATELGVWYHVAVSRVAGVTRLFLNGVRQGTDYVDATNYTSDQIVIGGRYAAVSGDYRSFNGYMECFRYTKGVGRYTTDFTPPTATLPFYDETLEPGDYTVNVGAFTGLSNVVCLYPTLDYGDKILRATPV